MLKKTQITIKITLHGFYSSWLQNIYSTMQPITTTTTTTKTILNHTKLNHTQSFSHSIQSFHSIPFIHSFIYSFIQLNPNIYSSIYPSICTQIFYSKSNNCHANFSVHIHTKNIYRFF